jgi:hypothetical protein
MGILEIYKHTVGERIFVRTQCKKPAPKISSIHQLGVVVVIDDAEQGAG